jgi:phage tail-like protein
MQTLRDRPLGSSNFLVEIGGASGRAAGAGFAEVIFPSFTIDTGTGSDGAALAGATAPSRHLVLRRGATGALDLYDWWDQARHGKAPRRRVVKVRLLADDQATVVMTWRFNNVRPLSLAYSPLQAMGGTILMETIELAFDAVEMTAA